MDKFFYIIFIKLYPLVARILSPFKQKAESWIKGRENIFEKIAAALSTDTSQRIWVHSSSLGEFEQGLPLIIALKKEYPNHKILLTFFSPSGYEVKKNSKDADYVFYLPIDSKKNAQQFLSIVRPSLILFVKYEFWYYYLKEAARRNIPLLLVSAIFLPKYSFFQWYGKMRREMLTYFTHLFLQTHNSEKLLASINVKNVSVTGDTRFDRVLEVASQPKDFPEILQFLSGKKTIVAGSTWLDDDEALDHFANTHPELAFIIAPHDIGNSRLSECDALYKNSIRYSRFKTIMDANPETSKPVDSANVLIIDNIGMLKFLYRHGTICYVGGGFGSDGIHNILEAAVYCKPVLFGPEFENFSEAIELVEKGGAFDVSDALELETQLNELLSDQELYDEACKISGNYVQSNAGATGAIMKYIQENRLLIN